MADPRGARRGTGLRRRSPWLGRTTSSSDRRLAEYGCMRPSDTGLAAAPPTRALAAADPVRRTRTAGQGRGGDARPAERDPRRTAAGHPFDHRGSGAAPGGRRLEVMEGQLGLLAGGSGDSGLITVQVLPFSWGAHAASGVGALAILQFSGVLELGVVHLGGAGGGVCLEGQEDLAVYTRVFEELSVFALSPEQSARMLRELADGLIARSGAAAEARHRPANRLTGS